MKAISPSAMLCPIGRSTRGRVRRISVAMLGGSMTRQRDTRPPLDELRLGFLSTAGQQPLRIAGDGALVRLLDGTFGVVSTWGQATKKLHGLTEQGSEWVDGDQLVQILAHPVLAAKLLIQLAQAVSALDQTDGA